MEIREKFIKVLIPKNKEYETNRIRSVYNRHNFAKAYGQEDYGPVNTGAANHLTISADA